VTRSYKEPGERGNRNVYTRGETLKKVTVREQRMKGASRTTTSRLCGKRNSTEKNKKKNGTVSRLGKGW